MKLLRILFGLAILGLIGLIIWQGADNPIIRTDQLKKTEEGIELNPNSTKIAFISNTGKNDVTSSLLKLIKSTAPKAVVHVGNLGVSENEDFKDGYNSIFSSIKKITFLPSIGEQDVPITDKIVKKFKLKKSYYSKNFKNVHLIALDSNLLSDQGKSDEMISWLKKDLAKNKSKITIAYFFHSPVSSESLHKSSDAAREKIIPVLDEYLVDFVITAENHNYQRSCPLNLTGIGEVCVSPGTLNIVTGGGEHPCTALLANVKKSSGKELKPTTSFL